MRARKVIRVVIESPYAGNIFQRWRNRRYARKCMLDSLNRGEAPYASHLLYTQVLDDSKPLDRSRGIMAGQKWLAGADAVAVYTDLGISKGMEAGINVAKELCKPIHYRSLDSKNSIMKAIHERNWTG